MKKIIVTTILICLYVRGFSQNISGEATYVFKQKVKIELDSTKYEASVSDEISAIFAKHLQEKFQLKFSNTKSLYTKFLTSNKPLDLKEDPYDQLFKDVKSKTYTHQVDLYGKRFLIKDSLTNYNWKLTSETKYIGKFKCHKAEAKINNEHIIAWFTSEIPINQGPGKFWGLPGLILEVKAGIIHIACTEVKVKQSKIIIEKPSKGKEITQIKFNVIKKEKEKEQQQRHGFMQGIEEDKN